MPNNEILLLDRVIMRIRFFDAQVAAGSSEYFEASQYERVNFHADAIEAGASVDIHGRNDVTKPLSATDGVVLITLTPTGLMGVTTEGSRWIKCKKLAGTAPSTVIGEAFRAV